MLPASSRTPRQRAAAACAACLASPLRFALFAVLAYGLAILPILARAHFDTSVFVVAGDGFTNAAALPVPIRVQPHSTGFDGQYYYRLALAPFDPGKTVYGITFDYPALRLQRVLYPLLARLLAFGVQSRIAAALLGVNLLALAGVAAMAVRLCARLRLPPILPAAMLLWPGIIITLTHDTTELCAVLFLLAALEAWLANRPVYLFLAMTAATMTRETALPVLAGLAGAALLAAIRRETGARLWPRLAACLAAFLPYFAWQAVLHAVMGKAAFAEDAGVNIGLPLAGPARTLLETLNGTRLYVHSPLFSRALRGFVLITAPALLVLCGLMAARLPAAWRDRPVRPLAAAWLPLAAVMTLLTGPWIDPVSYFRAFTECFAIGALLLGRFPLPAWLSRAYCGLGFCSTGVAWGLCVLALR